MRTFVAVEVADVGVLRAIRDVQEGMAIKARPVAPEAMHFTLQFLGRTSERACRDVQKALGQIRFDSFPVRLGGVGAFPGPASPRVVWAGADAEGGSRLAELADIIRESLLPLGFVADRQFVPHVTIFRVKSGAGDISKHLEKYRDARLGTEQVTGIKLKSSMLTPEGAIHSDLLEVRAA